MSKAGELSELCTDIPSKHGDAKNRFTALIKCTEAIAVELDTRPRLPENAVIIVDSPNKCPRGWVIFDKSAARVIVGAGNFSDGMDEKFAFDENGQKLKPYAYHQHGGESFVTLKMPQMPSHSHPVTSSPPHTNIHDGFGGSPNNYGLRPNYDPNVLPQTGWSQTQHHNFMGTLGNNQPHNNMPPYVALYFCKKSPQ
jgi:hypothetical protein